MFQNMIKAPKAFEDALVQMAEREAAELDAEALKTPSGSQLSCSLIVVKERHSRKCGVCNQPTATLYRLTAGEFQVKICPFCKGDLMEDIKKLDGGDDY